MRYLFFLLFNLIFFPAVQSQYLAAFNDYQRHFWVFEAGQFIKIEHLEIQEYQVGGILVAYIDNGSSLKIYRNGNVETLITGAPIQFKATDYLLGYSLYEQLNVYDNGNNLTLSSECSGYVVQDSLIGWYNRIKQTIQVYYNNEIYTLEDGLIYNPIEAYKTGDNTIAYVQNSTQQFKVFYRGEIWVLDPFVEDILFETGRDIVAYMDLPDQSFKVFYRGEETEIETFKPKSFRVGNEIMAYVDNLGKLKFFENGEIKVISNFEPQFYEITDKVLVFEEQGFFKTYCNGDVYIVERYIPQPYRIEFNTIAYLDQNRFLKAFQHCEAINVSYEKVKGLDIHRDLIIFITGINESNIYFNGTLYNH